jgi:ABC-type dipeptide/oligopeptide/nickel transport system ATPase component
LSKYEEHFRPLPSSSVEVDKHPLIAIAGASGCGKTESAMRIARGYVGPEGKFAIIDSDAKRALYKKSRHQPWDWVDFGPPFTPERCRAVLDACSTYDAVIFDSASDEYCGEGGLQEIADEAMEKMVKEMGADKAEKLTSLAWKDPKMRHKRIFMGGMRRYPTLLINCLRAEPKIAFEKQEFTFKDGRKGQKTVVVDKGFQPICEKLFMYDMLASFMMYADNPGVPTQVKALEDDLRPVFLLDRKIDESTGQRLRDWARAKPVMAKADPAPMKEAAAAAAPVPQEPGYITADQVIHIGDKLREAKIPAERMLKAGRHSRLEKIPAEKYQSALQWIEDNK